MAVYQALQALRVAFFPDNPFVYSGTAFFNILNSDYNSVQQSDLEPAAIFQPKSARDVATFIRTIKPFALDGSVPFAIRGGGQHTLPGSSNIGAMGITVDLQMLQGITVEDGFVSISAGERWKRVYKVLTSLGLGVAGSRVATGGIAGVALSGGVSFFSSREGLICDNVLNYEVVLSSGQIVNANARENRDLWKALKGGGNNFGVVTRFDMHLIKTYCKEINKPDADEDLNVMLHCGYNNILEDFCIVQLYHTREVKNADDIEEVIEHLPEVVRSFFLEDDSIVGTMHPVTLEEAANEQAQQPESSRCAFMNTTVKADAATLIAAFDLFNAAHKPLTSLEGITCTFVLQAYPISLLEKCNNSLGLNTANGPLMSIYLMNWWKSREDDQFVENTIRDLLHKIEELAAAKGTAAPYKDMNFSHTFQDPIASYGARRSGKLCLVSEKYDPDGLFQIGVPGGFKLV